MSRKSVAIAIQTRRTDGTVSFGNLANPADPVNGSTTAADQATLDAAATAVAADVATLVADGASPTQGHVTTLNTDYTALAAAITAFEADIAGVPATADVLISYNTSTVVSKSTLRLAVERLLQALPETL